MLSTALHDNARSVTLADRRTIDGNPAIGVRVEASDSSAMTEYFDVKTGLMLAIVVGDSSRAPDSTMTIRFTDYKRFGPVLVATSSTSVMPDGRSMVSRITHVDFEPIDSARFVPPAAVQASSPSRRRACRLTPARKVGDTVGGSSSLASLSTQITLAMLHFAQPTRYPS